MHECESVVGCSLQSADTFFFVSLIYVLNIHVEQQIDC